MFSYSYFLLGIWGIHEWWRMSAGREIKKCWVRDMAILGEKYKSARR